LGEWVLILYHANAKIAPRTTTPPTTPPTIPPTGVGLGWGGGVGGGVGGEVVVLLEEEVDLVDDD
jgi:hypothetical protein